MGRDRKILNFPLKGTQHREGGGKGLPVLQSFIGKNLNKKSLLLEIITIIVSKHTYKFA